MLSKKEIIYKHENVDEKVMKNYPNGYPYIDKAMDEHAQQMSIGFAEWVSHRYKQGIDRDKGRWFDHIGECVATTTEQLYQLYLETVK